MGWFGHTVGAERPNLPAGAVAFIWDDSHIGTSWSIRYRVPPKEEDATCLHVPGEWHFTDQAKAFAEAEWINGGERPPIPIGKV